MIDEKRPRLVVGVLAKKDNKYLLIQEKLEGGVLRWIVPGGGVEWGETLEEAAKRELLEETGLETNKITFLANYEAVFPKVGYHAVILFYLAEVVGGEVKVESKALDWGWFDYDDALGLDLVDSASWLFEESCLID